ncbi:MAG: hypothetical protein JOZ17_18895 [Acetobacteraceae bacterium]|nr:hypothetical protein [Acetobacteraceae bacterium]
MRKLGVIPHEARNDAETKTGKHHTMVGWDSSTPRCENQAPRTRWMAADFLLDLIA